MSIRWRAWIVAGSALFGMSVTSASHAALTADEAVKIALTHNSQIVNADASLLDAKSSLYGAYSGILPRVSASIGRDGSATTNSLGNQAVAGSIVVPVRTQRAESYNSATELSGSWSVLNLSALKGVQAAKGGVAATKLQRTSTRNDVVLATRQSFYETVRVYHLARVAAGALRVSRDNERRVHALFSVGSVSKSDLLKAEVRTAQSELDSLTAVQAIVNRRIELAGQMGVEEASMGDIDTTLTTTPIEVDEARLYEEAKMNRPDVRASELELKSAQSSESAAHYQRLPYVTVGGRAAFNLESSGYSTNFNQSVVTGEDSVAIRVNNARSTDQVISGSIALNWDFFDGLSTDARIAGAQARTMRARENRDALSRNLEGEVHQAAIAYREAVERERVATRAFESALENLKLIQQKYNVGSATILELVDAQEQATQAAAEGVSARAAIRIAEALIERVRGKGE